MAKFKKWAFRVLKVVGVMVALYFIIALFAPGDYRVERSKEMTVSPEFIYEQVSKFENWESWSPWIEKDPSATYSYSGESGTVGATSSWVGDPDLSGTGNMVATEMVANEKALYDLTFEGMGMTSHGGFTLEAAGESVKVTWYDEGDIPFVWRPMMLFMDIEAKIGPDFEKGLVKIDSIATIKQAEAAQLYTISEVDFPETSYYGVRQQLSMADIDSTVYGSAYGQLGMFCGTNQIEMAGMPVSINFEWNEAEGTIDIMPAFPVAKITAEGTEGITSHTIPASKALAIDYYGPYEGVSAAYMQMGIYLEENGFSSSLSLEEYVDDPGEAESMDDVLTRIYFILD